MGSVTETQEKDKPQPPAVSRPSALSMVSGQRLPASHLELSMRAAAKQLAQMMAAQERPRNEIAFIEKMKEKCMDEAFAEEAIYCVPVGGGAYAEGPSVFLARAMAAKYPNFELEVIEHSRVDKEVQYEVRVWDMENNIPQRKSSVARIDDWVKGNAQIGRVVRAAEAITEREMLFRVLPGWNDCYEVALQTLDKVSAKLAKHAKPYLQKLSTEFGVPIKTFTDFVNLHDDDKTKVKGAREAIDKIEGSHIRRLKAIRTAILSGEIRAEDVWHGAKTPDRAFDEKHPPVTKTGKPKASETVGETKDAVAKAEPPKKDSKKVEPPKKDRPTPPPPVKQEAEDDPFEEEEESNEISVEVEDDPFAEDEQQQEEESEQDTEEESETNAEEQEFEDETEEESSEEETDESEEADSQEEVEEPVQQTIVPPSTTKKRPPFKVK